MLTKNNPPVIQALVCLTLTIALLFSAACTPVHRDGSAYYYPGEDGAQVFRKAVKLQAAGEFDQALRLYGQVIQQYPNSTYVDDSIYRSGLVYREWNDYEQAEKSLLKLIQSYPDSPLIKDGWYNLSLLRFDNQRFESSIQAMKAYLDVDQGASMVSNAQIHIGKCYRTMLDYPQALVWYQKGYRSSSSNAGRHSALNDVNQILTEMHKVTDLESAREELEPGEVRNLVWSRLAELYAQQGRDKEARAILQGMGKEPRIEKPGGQAPIERTKIIGVGHQAVGVLLPLSGRYKVFGEQALKGILLGLGFFKKDDLEFQGLRLIIEDTMADPMTTTAAVNRLADNPEVVGIIGPLLSTTAQAAAEAAEERRIPILLMTRKENITDQRYYVFRNFLTHSQQVRRLVDFANKAYAVTHFGVMYPTSQRGKELMDLFVREVNRRELEVTAIVGYDPKATDFKDSIVGLHYATKKAGGLQALFIPDFHDRIMMIAPQLIYHDVKNVYLLGTSEWHSEELAEKTSGYLTRAVFTNAFYPDLESRESSVFVDLFHAADNDQDPTILAAFGYDNMKIIKESVLNDPAISRERLLGKLYNIRNVPGACGLTSFGKNGDANRPLLLLKVYQGRIIEVH